MTVEESVTAELDGVSGPLRDIALALARRLDDPEEKSPAPVAKELRATLAAIADGAPAEEVDLLDQITQRRTRRRAGTKAS